MEQDIQTKIEVRIGEYVDFDFTAGRSHMHLHIQVSCTGTQTHCNCLSNRSDVVKRTADAACIRSWRWGPECACVCVCCWLQIESNWAQMGVRSCLQYTGGGSYVTEKHEVAIETMGVWGPEKQCIPVVPVRVFLHVSRGEGSYTSHTLLCQLMNLLECLQWAWNPEQLYETGVWNRDERGPTKADY